MFVNTETPAQGITLTVGSAYRESAQKTSISLKHTRVI